MIGLLIISHCDLGKEFINAAELIMGKLEAADSISITQTTESKEILKEISKKISALDQGQGVLVLTDMFGGTPSNISLLSFHIVPVSSFGSKIHVPIPKPEKSPSS